MKAYRPSRLITVCFKVHSPTLMSGRSANIAVLALPLVNAHTSLTTTTSLPDMESGTRQERPPSTAGHFQTPPTARLIQAFTPPPPPPSLPVFSWLFQRCQSHSRGMSRSQKVTESAERTLWPRMCWMESFVMFFIGSVASVQLINPNKVQMACKQLTQDSKKLFYSYSSFTSSFTSSFKSSWNIQMTL